mgnify:CR=1 FL=1
MKTKVIPPVETRSPFVDDAILKERVKKETMHHKTFEEFSPSPWTLTECTPDKPLVRSLCSDPPPPEDELTVSLRSTLHLRGPKTRPRDVYDYPQTTSMEIGWDAFEPSRHRSMFDHRHKKTDITTLPSKWDPHANTVTTAATQ